MYSFAIFDIVCFLFIFFYCLDITGWVTSCTTVSDSSLDDLWGTQAKYLENKPVK